MQTHKERAAPRRPRRRGRGGKQAVLARADRIIEALPEPSHDEEAVRAVVRVYEEILQWQPPAGDGERGRKELGK